MTPDLGKDEMSQSVQVLLARMQVILENQANDVKSLTTYIHSSNKEFSERLAAIEKELKERVSETEKRIEGFQVAVKTSKMWLGLCLALLTFITGCLGWWVNTMAVQFREDHDGQVKLQQRVESELGRKRVTTGKDSAD